MTADRSPNATRPDPTPDDPPRSPWDEIDWDDETFRPRPPVTPGQALVIALGLLLTVAWCALLVYAAALVWAIVR